MPHPGCAWAAHITTTHAGTRRSSQQSRTDCVEIPPCPGCRAHVPHHMAAPSPQQYMHTACPGNRCEPRVLLDPHQVWMTSGCIPMHVAPAPPLCTPQCPVPPHAPPRLCMGSTHHNYTCWHRRSSQQSRTPCVQIPPCPGGRAHVPHHRQFMHTACNRTRQLKPRYWCQWW